MNKTLDQSHQEVPGDYYHNALAYNIFQRFWHTRRFSEYGKIVVGVKAKRILDVGCHGGRFTYEISKLFPKASIYGIDISSKAINFAKSKYAAMHFQVARAERLPFLHNTFDLVNCLEVLEHVEDPKKVVYEIYKVLKPGGIFIVIIPSENLLFKIIWFFWTHLGPGRVWHHTHIQKFRRNNFDRLLENGGFEILYRKDFLLGMISIVHSRRTS